MGVRKGQEGGITKEIRKLGDKGYVHYHGDGFTDVYICQSLSNCILPTCSVYCIPIITQ